jgi:hypothetical protein
MTTVQRTEPVAGCWIDGTWGWRGIIRVIEIAEEHGMTLTEQQRSVVNDADRDGVYEEIVGLADEAEEWLNEQIAPEGWSFGWHDGELFLWSDADWETV